MGIEEWDTNSSGTNIMMLPLSKFSLFAADMTIGVKLDYYTVGDRTDAPSGRLQLILTAQQADDLGRALQNAVRIARARPTADKPS